MALRKVAVNFEDKTLVSGGTREKFEIKTEAEAEAEAEDEERSSCPGRIHLKVSLTKPLTRRSKAKLRSRRHGSLNRENQIVNREMQEVSTGDIGYEIREATGVEIESLKKGVVDAGGFCYEILEVIPITSTEQASNEIPTPI